jgi:hypothetical protein
MSNMNSDQVTTIEREQPAPLPSEEFFPKGAIAFFIALLVGFSMIWAGVYMLMVHRQFHP